MNNKERNMQLFIWLVFSVVIPFAVLHMSYFKGFTSLDMFGYALAFILVISGIFSFYLNSLSEKLTALRSDLENQQNIFKDQQSNLAERLIYLGNLVKAQKSSDVLPLKRDETYSHLKVFASTAKFRIDLTYLGEKPPVSYQKSNSRSEYIASLADRISKQDVPVRRIILNNDNNKEWIKNLVQENKGKTSFSLYLLDKNFIGAVSIQIFDDSKVVIINLDSSEVSSKPTAILVDSIEMCPIFESYYARMLAAATPIVHDGVVDTESYKKFF